MPRKRSMTYRGAGLDYEPIDMFVKMAQTAALRTAHNLDRHGYAEVEDTRTQSAYLIHTPLGYLGHTGEELGTLPVAAQAFYEQTEGKTHCFESVGQGAVAAIVNDLITQNVIPLSVSMNVAAGSSEWFADTRRGSDLINGWRNGCKLARCSWGQGETSALPDLIRPNQVHVTGSGVGLTSKKLLIHSSNIKEGDRIVFFHSSGVHINGVTLARKIARRQKKGYLTKLKSGQTYGDALLEPTNIYVGAIEDCLNNGVEIAYSANMSGHGWRKVMRADAHFTYVIEELPPCPEIFEFIALNGPVSTREMFMVFNNGAGFMVIVPENSLELIAEVFEEHGKSYGFGYTNAGYVMKSKSKKVVIKPRGDLEILPDEPVH